MLKVIVNFIITFVLKARILRTTKYEVFSYLKLLKTLLID